MMFVVKHRTSSEVGQDQEEALTTTSNNICGWRGRPKQVNLGSAQGLTEEL